MKHISIDTIAQSEAVSPKRTEPVQSFYSKAGKRAFDLTLALLISPIVVPVILVLWALTKLDGGPGFFGQVRVGKDKKYYKCWKIRTMRVDAEEVLTELCKSNPEIAREWNENQKLKNDPRITAVGRFMRATSLDELPQFLNIVKGEMSFVGPRPFMAQQMQMYQTAGGRSYFEVRPGITGTWQVYGRGQTKFSDRVHYDDIYHNGLSFKQDIGLIFKTVGVVLRATGT